MATLPAPFNCCRTDRVDGALGSAGMDGASGCGDGIMAGADLGNAGVNNTKVGANFIAGSGKYISNHHQTTIYVVYWKGQFHFQSQQTHLHVCKFLERPIPLPITANTLTCM